MSKPQINPDKNLTTDKAGWHGLKKYFFIRSYP